MAKELPYFQFEPAEYLTGDISFCSLSTQGLFTNLCSYYWQRSCKLTKEQFLRRLNHPKELQELIDENVIEVKDNVIIIRFLDAQFDKATKQSKTNSINGSKGGRPKKQNPKETEIKPKLNPIESETKGIREDKIKEEEKKEDNLHYKSEREFLEDWNRARVSILKVKASNISKLNFQESTDFNLIKRDFTKEDFKNGIRGLLKQKEMFASNTLRPKHFLSDMNIEKYIDAHTNNKQLYETKNKYDVKL